MSAVLKDRDIKSIIVEPLSVASSDEGYGDGGDKPHSLSIANVLSDQPALQDSFNFVPFVRTLASVALSRSTETPITIAVHGEWGTGKTSVLRMVEQQATMLGMPSLWLNAWSLETGDSLIAAVGSEVLRLSGNKSGIGKTISDLFKNASYSFPVVGSALRAGDALRKVEDNVQEVASVVSARRSFEQVIDSLFEQRRFSISDPRVLIFIDDLDRALPDQVATILKNLKLIIESKRCVFVVAMDIDVVSKSVEKYYDSRGGRGYSGAAFGERFLEKLFQLRFDVPPLNRTSIQGYLDSIGVLPEVQEIIRWAPESETTNPRRLKRYLNWLSITLQLIRSIPLPKALSALTLLRILAFKQSYPAAYQLFVNAKNLLWSDAGWPDRESRVDFIQYFQKFSISIQDAEEFLRNTPLLNASFRGRATTQLQQVGGQATVQSLQSGPLLPQSSSNNPMLYNYFESDVKLPESRRNSTAIRRVIRKVLKGDAEVISNLVYVAMPLRSQNNIHRFTTIATECSANKCLAVHMADVAALTAEWSQCIPEMIGAANLVIFDVSESDPAVLYQLGVQAGFEEAPEEAVLVISDNREHPHMPLQYPVKIFRTETELKLMVRGSIKKAKEVDE